jgi:hypothetical protein
MATFPRVEQCREVLKAEVRNDVCPKAIVPRPVQTTRRDKLLPLLLTAPQDDELCSLLYLFQIAHSRSP